MDSAAAMQLKLQRCARPLAFRPSADASERSAGACMQHRLPLRPCAPRRRGTLCTNTHRPVLNFCASGSTHREVARSSSKQPAAMAWGWRVGDWRWVSGVGFQREMSGGGATGAALEAVSGGGTVGKVRLSARAFETKQRPRTDLILSEQSLVQQPLMVDSEVMDAAAGSVANASLSEAQSASANRVSWHFFEIAEAYLEFCISLRASTGVREVAPAGGPLLRGLRRRGRDPSRAPTGRAAVRSRAAACSWRARPPRKATPLLAACGGRAGPQRAGRCSASSRGPWRAAAPAQGSAARCWARPLTAGVKHLRIPLGGLLHGALCREQGFGDVECAGRWAQARRLRARAVWEWGGLEAQGDGPPRCGSHAPARPRRARARCGGCTGSKAGGTRPGGASEAGSGLGAARRAAQPRGRRRAVGVRPPSGCAIWGERRPMAGRGPY
jgi:hypothetical protein